MTRSTVSVAAAVVALYVVVLPVATLAYALFTASSHDTSIDCQPGDGPGGGPQHLSGRDFSGEQMDNAQTIVQVTGTRGLPRRAAVIALTAAITESSLKNDHFGDRDSLGLFQERPSTGWGSPEQVINPIYATGKFLDHLITVPDWNDPQQVSVGAAAQAVEVSAFPSRYQPNAAAAEDLVSRFWQGSDNPSPPAASGGSQPAQQVSVPTACPDQGQSNLPLDAKNAREVPAGYQLPADPRQRAVVQFALAQLGKPYVFGAKGPDAFDCSGLVQAAWASAGVGMAGSTFTQVHEGAPVTSVTMLQPGDLIFIPGSDGTPANPGHVGLSLGQGLLINAYDSKTGIVLDEVSNWAGQIVAIRRPAPASDPAVMGGLQA